MYKAIAEAVSGLKVFANGQWLTCIGNKGVRVGDRIWTDGRCVYGFNREAQSPMVITPPKVEDWGIPIVIDRRGYVYTKNGLKELGELPRDEKRESYPCITNSSTKIYGSKDTYELTHHGIFAVNADADNNTYVLGAKDWNIYIWKNGEMVKTVQSGYDTYHTPFTPILAFIENENNWYIVKTERWDNSTQKTEYVGETHLEHIHWENEVHGLIIDYDVTEKSYKTTEIADAGAYLYLLSRDGSLTLATATYTGKHVYTEYYPYAMGRSFQGYPLAGATAYYYHMEQITETRHITRSVKTPIKIPMHNGFYYVINSFDYEPDAHRVLTSEPRTINISIFNAADTPILKGTCLFNTYLTACKLKSGGYLLGVKKSFNTLTSAADKDALFSGLYLVTNKDKLKLIKQGDITNQKLQEMKNCNNWLNKLQQLAHP